MPTLVRAGHDLPNVDMMAALDTRGTKAGNGLAGRKHGSYRLIWFRGHRTSCVLEEAARRTGGITEARILPQLMF